MKPGNMLIYYGWLNSFNSAVHQWNNNKVAKELAQYNILVFGDGIQSSSHGDYSNTTAIISRIKVLNPDCKIFGYVTINQTFANFKTKAGEWNTLGVHGIFLDEAGYDYGTTATNSREEFNRKVDYVHSLSSANVCFANAWEPEYILGTENNASYPNTTWNPNLVESNLTEEDWCLLESFAITSTPAFQAKATWLSKGNNWNEYRDTYGVNLAACSVILDSDQNGQDKFDFIFTSACMWGLNAVGSSDAAYGATNAKSKFWDRPDIGYLWDIMEDEGVVINCNVDVDVYYRYLEAGLLAIDFSSGSETSSITKY